MSPVGTDTSKTDKQSQQKVSADSGHSVRDKMMIIKKLPYLVALREYHWWDLAILVPPPSHELSSGVVGRRAESGEEANKGEALWRR